MHLSSVILPMTFAWSVYAAPPPVNATGAAPSNSHAANGAVETASPPYGASNTQYLLDAAHMVNIKQTMSMFPILVDSVRYSEMGSVFTDDVVGYLDSTGQASHGLEAVVALTSKLKDVPSQHHLTTEHVILQSPTTANATNYLISKYFGGGTGNNQIFTVFGVYEWKLVLTNAGWKANYIKLIYRDTQGNKTIAS
ncbi:MAG: hypothetical protein M1828_006674 [Chrysothrix sp. TS-e1954]|nr:MAG: hypothetical protein M1828_006674 [Chrysothrix sp. TS-e1954]